MKKIILCLLFVFTVYTSSAQSDSLSAKYSISVLFGAAYPTGDFNSTDFEDTFTPFAISGPLAQISYLQSIKPYLQVGATLGLRRNPMDLDGFISETDELVLSRSSEPWQSVFTMADVQFRFSTLTKNWFVKASAGAAFNRSASLHVETPYGTINYAADKTMSLAYGLSGGLLMDIKQFSLGFETGVLTTAPTFKLKDKQGKTTSYKLPMLTINMGISASYNF